MGALGYYLERAGLMTTGISLVRENTESLQPPRSLWVSFPLGRPLGVPGDAAFQHRVIDAALSLLHHTAGPVLQDFPEDAPACSLAEAPTCPVTFTADTSSWIGRLHAELRQLAPWYELGYRRRGRTLVGVSRLAIEDILTALGEDLDAERLPTDLKQFKAAIEDAKAYYVEAFTAQPGQYAAEQVYAMLWHETQLGSALRLYYERFAAHPKLASFARIVLPRNAVQRVTDPVEANPGADIEQDQLP